MVVKKKTIEIPETFTSIKIPKGYVWYHSIRSDKKGKADDDGQYITCVFKRLILKSK